MALSAFGKAFAEARKAGDTEFTFGGKKYNTRLKGESGMPQVTPRVKNEVAPSTVRNLGAAFGIKSPSSEEMSDSTYNPDVKTAPKSVRRTSDENTEELSDMTYKKGGKVKGWGKARGARAAKFY